MTQCAFLEDLITRRNITEDSWSVDLLFMGLPCNNPWLAIYRGIQSDNADLKSPGRYWTPYLSYALFWASVSTNGATRGTPLIFSAMINFNDARVWIPTKKHMCDAVIVEKDNYQLLKDLRTISIDNCLKLNDLRRF